MKKILLVLGGRSSESFLKAVCKKEQPDAVVAADGALKLLFQSGIDCDYAAGDFDTADREIVQYYEDNGHTKIFRYPPEKDDTDSMICFKLAASLKPEQIIIVAATGGRLDHELANIELLRTGLNMGISSVIIDEHNCITLLDCAGSVKKDDSWKYISFLPYTDCVRNLTLEGFKYNIRNYELRKGDIMCVSNEIKEDIARIEFSDGILLCIRSKD